MLVPVRVLVLTSFAAAVACRGADSARRESASSPAAASTPVAATAARQGAAVPTDSISERADHGRIRGNAKATLWIIEASDFQCPFCKMWHDSTYGSLVKNYVES